MKKITHGISEEQGRISSDNYTNFYLTYDLGCSSALVNSGFELVSLDKSNPKKVRLIFRRELGIEKVVDDYFANRLSLKARGFFDNIKSIKNRLYSSE
ncbi:MAG: hypothetical protein EOM84_00505 [Sphingobacteriia bacterium]|jgi:hypothetical protein|nr:hypothetical protein [Sphingobacteriia bacterium]